MQMGPRRSRLRNQKSELVPTAHILFGDCRMARAHRGKGQKANTMSFAMITNISSFFHAILTIITVVIDVIIAVTITYIVSV